MSRDGIRLLTPIRLALLVAALALLALPASAGAFVYWANAETGSIGRASLDGSVVNQSLITGADVPEGVAVDGQHIYYLSTLTTIGRANLDGSGVNPNFITGASEPIDIAVDAQHIYWANNDSDSIGRANLDGSGVNQSFIAATHPGGVAVDGQHIYWANSGGSNPIGRANLDGTGVNQTFIASPGGPTGLGIDSQHIYWANYGNGTAGMGAIGRANLDGTGVNVAFISGLTAPVDVGVDAGSVYWTSLFANTIGRANIDGAGVNSSFITGASEPWGIAVDSLPHATTTQVACPASTADPRGRVRCTATVSDPTGGPAPTNLVSFSSSSPGGFAPNPECTLAATSTTQSSCHVTYAPTSGSQTVTAEYRGDFAHGTSSGTARVIARPDTKITKAKANQKTDQATFRFKAIGGATKFQCALKSKRHHHPRFRRCTSPKTYKHLKPGRYVFKVRAKGPGGTDPTPAKKRFRIR